ncbi:hypothetical protein SAMN05216326_1342 [Nitrosomonas marina]|uniref:Uncharacterized protein n=1 Tax=Nitrosomonas marina TaxID=917 RepID=A0A1I0F534_9PROT|nr:hypothetical protein [Nitrosomonas marina]SET53049.1 hypothetical protein SAMN05216326_1342 [Nitrosomonas marina]
MNSKPGVIHDSSLYEAFSRSPERAAGNKPCLSIYRSPGKAEYGAFSYKAPVDGLLQIGGPQYLLTMLRVIQ